VKLDVIFSLIFYLTMKYNGVIQRKFALLDKNFIKLQNHLENVNFVEFSNNWVLHCATERV